MKEANALRLAGRLVTYIEQHVTLAGTDKREEVLALFDSMQRLFPYWAIMTCPIMHADMRYISRNAADVLKHDNPGSIVSMENYFSYVHEADTADLHACFTHGHEFLEPLPPASHCEYRLVFHYRFRKQNGQYMYVHDEKAVLNLPGSGNLYYTLFRDITAEKNFGGVKLEILKQGSVLNKLQEYKPSAQRSSLTPREGQLVTLIKQGLSTKEIAGYLKISHNTVRNIKSKLFEKYNVNNTIELLNMTA